MKEVSEKELWNLKLHELGFYIRRGKHFDVIGVKNTADPDRPYEIVLGNIGVKLKDSGVNRG